MTSLSNTLQVSLSGFNPSRSCAGPGWNSPPPGPFRSGVPSGDSAEAAATSIAQRGAGPEQRPTVENPRDYADKMLLAALQEAQSVLRSYDAKAQIVGAGYILALNLILYFGGLLPTRAPLGPLFFAIVWGVVLMPIVQFGHVLYPSRKRAEQQFLAKTSCESEHTLFYVDPDAFLEVRDFVRRALKADWTAVLAAELLKTSRVRVIKQARFRRGLMMVVVSFVVLGADQFVRSLSAPELHHSPSTTLSQSTVSSTSALIKSLARN